MLIQEENFLLEKKIYAETLNFENDKKIVISLKEKNQKAVLIRFLPKNCQIRLKNLEIISKTDLIQKIEGNLKLRVFGKEKKNWELLKILNIEELLSEEILLTFPNTISEFFFESENCILTVMIYIEHTKEEVVEEGTTYNINKDFSLIDNYQKFEKKKFKFQFSEKHNSCQLFKSNIISEKLTKIFPFDKNFYENFQSKKILREIENFNLFLIENLISEFPDSELIDLEGFKNFFDFLLKNKPSFPHYLLLLETIQTFFILNINNNTKKEENFLIKVK